MLSADVFLAIKVIFKGFQSSVIVRVSLTVCLVVSSIDKGSWSNSVLRAFSRASCVLMQFESSISPSILVGQSITMMYGKQF